MTDIAEQPEQSDAQRLAAELKAQRSDPSMEQAFIVTCPVCASAEDVFGEGEHKVTCNNCNTEFIIVHLSAEAVANFSLH